ncbi:hypothetical protein L7F22_040552 [Adiantum nelumboides]|nr:hypothetical protein [Adiantum nelumboides]
MTELKHQISNPREFLAKIFGSDSEMEDVVEIEDILEAGMENMNAQATEYIEGIRQLADGSHNGVSTTTEVIAPTKAKKATIRKFRQEWINIVRHTGFQSLLKEIHLQVLEVLNIQEGGWLARGNVMERLTQLMPAILNFWKDKAKGWYDKLWVYKVLFCVYMLANVLRDLNVLNTHFQKENVDIPSISVEIEVIVASLKHKFLEQEFGKGNHFLKKFLDATKDRVFVYVSDDGEEFPISSCMLKFQAMMPNGLPLDREGGDVESCINFAKGFVLKVIECVNDRFPDVYFSNVAKLFSPHYYPHRTKIAAEDIKAREKKFSEWLEKFGGLVDIDNCMAELLLFIDTLYYGCEGMNMLDAWCVFCSNKNWMQTYVNLTKLWQHMLVLPVSSVSCERGFSKQNLIKTNARECLNVETLEALMRVSLLGPSIENVEWKKINPANATEAVRVVREAKHLPTILLSAAKNVNLMMEGIAAGALECLEKPLTEDNAKNLWQHVFRKALAIGELTIPKHEVDNCGSVEECCTKSYQRKSQIKQE